MSIRQSSLVPPEKTRVENAFQAPGRQPLRHREGLLLTVLFTTATLLFLALHWMNDTFGTVTFDQIQFVYHSSLAGVDRTIVFSFLGRLSLIIVFGAAFFFLVFRPARAAKGLLGARTLRWGTTLYFLAALACTGNTLGIASLIARQDSPFIQNRYAVPSQQHIVFPEKRRNLILVVAESAEHTFNNPEIFPDLVMPELGRIAEEHLSFKGHVQVPGTEWTIAGITSFLFGLPLRLPLFDWNDYSLFDTFLPGAESLLEVLAREGYEITFLLGSDASFSGKKNLFQVHAPEASVRDLNYLKTTRDDVDANAGTGWGVADAYLFDRAREFLSQRDSDAPFVLIIETVDTHNPDPFVHESSPRKWGDYRDAFAALSVMVHDFTGWVREQDFFDNTTLVILGDHLHMANDLGPVDLSEEKREVFNAFINSARQSPGTDRVFASFDLCPTILESLGASISGGRFGLGVSLFHDSPTLLEELGVEPVISELSQFSPYYMTFYKEARQL